MTHICVKDEGAHFHGIFSCCERATALSSSQQIQQSSGYLLADISSLSSQYAMCNHAPNFTRSCARSRSFQLCEQTTQKIRPVGQRLAVELLHLLRLYYITTNCVQWYILARCMRQRTYSMFNFFRKERVQRVQSASKRSKFILSYSANDHGAHHLHPNLKKAQKVAAVMSSDNLTPPF